MRVKLFSCHHSRPVHLATGDLFMPLWSGGTTDNRRRWLTDLDGVNIHHLRLDEMRQQYFVWKNLLWSLDYVGFEQYRRLLMLDPLPAAELQERYPRVLAVRRKLAAYAVEWRGVADADTFRDYLRLREELLPTRVAALTDWISRYDIIAPRRYVQFNVEEQWLLAKLPRGLWDQFIDKIRCSAFMRHRTNFVQTDQVGAHFCNMFIMTTALFDEYMSFWSEVVLEMFSAYDQSSRDVGFLSERLFSFWLLQKQVENPLLRVAEVPHLFGEDMDGVRDRLIAEGHAWAT